MGSGWASEHPRRVRQVEGTVARAMAECAVCGEMVFLLDERAAPGFVGRIAPHDGPSGQMCDGSYMRPLEER